jgi:hypothetical protein
MTKPKYRFDNHILKKKNKVAVDVLDKAYLDTSHGRAYLFWKHGKDMDEVAIDYVGADSVVDAVEKVSKIASKRKLKIARLRFFGHGNVGLIFFGGNLTETDGKFIKFEKGKLIGGQPLKKLKVAMAEDGWVELHGCSIMAGYQEPGLFDKIVGKQPQHDGASMLKAMAKLIAKPVRAADQLQPANASSIDRWDGQVYEAKPDGSIRKLGEDER